VTDSGDTLASSGPRLTPVQLDPGKHGPQFERLCRWYLTNAPEYRRPLQADLAVVRLAARLVTRTTPHPDLDCEDVGSNIPVGRDDPNGLDRDGDGIDCES
jgi:hypothetical protein